MQSAVPPTLRAIPWLIIAAIVLIGFNLRGPVVAVAPVVGMVSRDLTLDSSQAGLLTSIPLLCFAFATPVAAQILRWAGRDLAASITLVGLVIGTLIRSSGGVPSVFIGTVVLGIFITVGNIVIPLIIADEVPSRHSGMATGAYTASLNVGSMITTLGTAQLAVAFGWRAALATWTGLAVIAFGSWVLAVRRRAVLRRHRAPIDSDRGPAPQAVRVGTVIALGVAFGAQAFAFYGMTAWLPQLLADQRGFSPAEAGSGSAVFQIFGVAGALILPLIVRWIGARAGVIIVLMFWLSVPLGLATAPQLWLLWTVIGGLAQGGGITMMFLLVVSLSGGARGGRVSATVQGIGYGIAATAPAILGGLHDATDSWNLPLVAVAVSVLIAAILALITMASSARHPATAKVTSMPDSR